LEFSATVRPAAAAIQLTPRRYDTMSIAKVTEIIAASPKGFEDALQEGIARANKTLKNVQGAWVSEQKVVVEKGKITEYRVTMRVTFVLKN
jgi:dodecin